MANIIQNSFDLCRNMNFAIYYTWLRLSFILCIQYILTECKSQNLISNTKTNTDYIFHHITEDDGLSYNIINCFFKDSRGIMWIGTYNGFNRYDGANFYNYKIRKGTSSLINEAIHSLCEDNNGDIWGSTSSGVFCYKIKEDRYINYHFKELESPRWFFNILCTKKEGLIITSYRDQIYKYNSTRDTFELLANLNYNKDSLISMYVTKNGMLEDSITNTIWMTTNYGLINYNLTTNTLKNHKTNPHIEIFKKNNTSPITKSKSGNFWMYNGSSNELTLFSPIDFQILRRISLNSLKDFGHLNTIFEDKNERLWLSGWLYNTCVYDLTKNEFTILKHDPQDIRSIASNLFWGAYQDDDNTIWLGTVAGISKCNPESSIYKEYRLETKIPELKNTHIHRINEDPADSTFWFVSKNNLLFNYNPKTEKYKKYDLTQVQKNIKGQLPDYVNQINFNNDYIIVSAYHGSWQMKKGNNTFIPYRNLPEGYKDFKCCQIIFKKDSIYFNNGREILHWNLTNNDTYHYQYENDSTIPNQETILSDFILTNDNKLWAISPPKHLAFLNKNKQLTRLNMYQSNMVGDGSIISLDKDSKGKIWYVFNNIGLYQYDPFTQKLKGWNETDGLPGNRIQQVKIDDYDRVWTMMYNKISVYIPESDAFYNIKIPYSEHDLNYANHLVKGTNGSIFGIIANEIVEFFPNRLFSNYKITKPQISQVFAPGREIPIWGDELIQLKIDENTLKIQFGSYTDNTIFPYNLEFRLSGAEKSWTIAGKRHEALYNNLSSGHYTFELKAKSKNSQWESEITKLHIVIPTPFYKTWWFILLISSAIFLIAYSIIRSKAEGIRNINLLKSKTQLLEKEKAIVMYENLKQHLNPHFLFNSLTSLSSLIRLDQKKAGEFLEKMSKVYRYILRNKDNETVLLIDELNFVDMYVQLQKTRFEDGLIIQQNIPEEILHRRIAPVTLQNLIENAIKHNTADPENPLIIELFQQDNYLVIRNNLQKKNFVETSNQQGQQSMISLYNFLSSVPIEIEESKEYYTVKLPLL